MKSKNKLNRRHFIGTAAAGMAVMTIAAKGEPAVGTSLRSENNFGTRAFRTILR